MLDPRLSSLQVILYIGFFLLVLGMYTCVGVPLPSCVCIIVMGSPKHKEDKLPCAVTFGWDRTQDPVLLGKCSPGIFSLATQEHGKGNAH